MGKMSNGAVFAVVVDYYVLLGNIPFGDISMSLSIPLFATTLDFYNQKTVCSVSLVCLLLSTFPLVMSGLVQGHSTVPKRDLNLEPLDSELENT